ncbi:MAG: tetratricopeptide repeat protein, partial [Cyanobacteria bacterium J06635_10]
LTAYEKALKGDISKNDNVTPAMILTNKGVANWHLGKYSSAIDSIKKATELNPELFEVWYNRGVVFL